MKNVSEKRLLTGLAACGTGIAAAIVNFYGFFITLSGVANCASNGAEFLPFTGIPLLLFAVEMNCIFVLALQRHAGECPAGSADRSDRGYGKNLPLLFLIFSAAGILSALAAGVTLYGSFTDPYPFPGYLILVIAVHGAVILISAALLRRRKKMTYADNCAAPSALDRPACGKSSPGVFLSRVLIPVYSFYALNRLGALLWSVTYMYTLTADAVLLCLPFYLSLAVPAVLLAGITAGSGGCRSGCLSTPGFAAVMLAVSTLLTALCRWAETDTLFLSATSPALGLDRIAAWGYVFHAHLAVIVGTPLVLLLFSLLERKKRRTSSF